MFRPQVAAVLFTLALALNPVKCSEEVIDSNDLSIGSNFDDSKYVADGVNFNYMKPVTDPLFSGFRNILKESLTKNKSPRLSIPYELGKRQNGDKLLVRYKSPRREAGSGQNIKQSEAFEFEATITFVRVVVEQSTNEGKITNTSGGLGQKTIDLETEATNTLYFSYTTEIYGY